MRHRSSGQIDQKYNTDGFSANPMETSSENAAAIAERKDLKVANI